MDFTYKRGMYQIFTIGNFLLQLSDGIREFGKRPSVIYLPPEEYFHLLLWMKEKDISKKEIEDILGSVLEITYGKVDGDFSY